MDYDYDRRGARKPNPVDQANAARWQKDGRKKFVAWAEHKFLPVFEKALASSKSVAGDLFGESVFEDLVKFIHGSPELRDFGKHFGYPAAGAKDDALLGMWGQTLGSLRLRQPGGRLQTPNDVYEREYTVLKGLVDTLKTLG